MKRKAETNALDAQLGRAMRKMIEQMEKSEDREAKDYQRGGQVRAPGNPPIDSILARVTKGEYILPVPAVDMVGVENLEAIRQAALAKAPRYALGGIAGLALGSSGQNLQTPGESTSTTFYPPAMGNTLPLGGLGLSGGMRPATTQPSGPTNSYGNDLSLTNRMNAGADAMRTMREGPATTTTPKPEDFVTSLTKALQANDPAKQAQDAYQAAQAKAAPLDVASGRFDREYAPGMAQGGLIGQDQWEGLPRFAQGMSPEDFAKANREQVERIVQGIGSWLASPADTSRMPGSQFPRLDQPKQPTPSMAAVLPQAPRTLAVAPTPNPDANPATRPGPSGPVLASSVASLPSQPLLPSPDQEASRRMGLKQLTSNLDRAAMRAAGATPVPGADVYRQVAPAPGFGPTNPNRVPGPGQTAGTTTYTVPGVSAMGGGAPGSSQFQGLPKSGGFLGYVGTPETAGMTQAEATAYNVANLNRQYEAMKSRNEAYGWGGGNVPAQGAGMDTAEMMRQSNPFYAPGQGFGDDVMARDRFMRNLPQGQGRRALQARNEAMKGLGDIQKGRLQGLLGMAQTQQRGQEAGLDAANQRMDAKQKANQWLMDYQQRQSGQEFARQQAQIKQPYELAALAQKAKGSPQTQPTMTQAIAQEYQRAIAASRDASATPEQRQQASDYAQKLVQQLYPPRAGNQLDSLINASQ